MSINNIADNRKPVNTSNITGKNAISECIIHKNANITTEPSSVIEIHGNETITPMDNTPVFNVIFSAGDIDYLVLNFSENQLKYERWRAGLEIHSCHTWSELEKDWFFWFDYHKAVELALEIIQSNKPKPQPIPGRITVDIEAVKQRNDIVSVIDKYTPLKKAGSRFTGRCPLHQERNPSLTVYPDQQSWYCFSCNTGGDVVAFIRAADQCDFKQAIAILGG